MRGGCVPSPGVPATGPPVCAQATSPQAASTAKPKRRTGKPSGPAAGRGQGRTATGRQEVGSKTKAKTGDKSNNDSSGQSARPERTNPPTAGTVFYQPVHLTASRVTKSITVLPVSQCENHTLPVAID
ncbi:hypothetical protein D3C72_1361670 [compost metagenome]